MPAELRSLVIFDHKAFREYQGDWFDADYWKQCVPWWMIVNGKKVGCCAFEHNVDFREDLSLSDENPFCRGSLYISSTGILPNSQGKGLGKLLKHWQLAYASYHGFTRIVTNHRESNRRIIRLNKSVGFKVARTTANYYENPTERVVVMELKL